MRIVHILKDGTRVDDISGHIVKLEDARPLYQLLHNLNRRKAGKDDRSNTYGKNEVTV